jgi:hypothetical protein
MRKRPRVKVRRLVVPVVLAATAVASVAALSTATTACTNDEPPPSVDAMPDTPII